MPTSSLAKNPCNDEALQETAVFLSVSTRLTCRSGHEEAMQADTHPSPFSLERLVADDLAEDAKSAVVAHLSACSSCSERIDALKADVAAFAAEVPYSGFRARHEEKMSRRKGSLLRLRWTFPTLTAAAALAGALLVVVGTDPGNGSPLSETRLKGAGVALSFTVREKSGITRLGSSGEELAPGTVLQLAYDAGENTHVALLGVDAKGVVTVYFPERGERLAPAPSGSQGVFPFSLTLARKVDSERFYAVFAKGPEKLAGVEAAARSVIGQDLTKAATLELPLGVSQSSFYVREK
jgi:hypothetical protein